MHVSDQLVPRIVRLFRRFQARCMWVELLEPLLGWLQAGSGDGLCRFH